MIGYAIGFAILFYYLAFGGMELHPTVEARQRGSAGAQAVSFLVRHRAVMRYMQVHPAHVGELTAAQLTVPDGHDATQWQWRSTVNAAGVAVTYAPDGLLANPGAVMAAIARLAPGEPGVGISENGRVQGNGPVTLMVPAGVPDQVLVAVTHSR